MPSVPWSRCMSGSHMTSHLVKSFKLAERAVHRVTVLAFCTAAWCLGHHIVDLVGSHDISHHFILELWSYDPVAERRGRGTWTFPALSPNGPSSQIKGLYLGKGKSIITQNRNLNGFWYLNHQCFCTGALRLYFLELLNQPLPSTGDFVIHCESYLEDPEPSSLILKQRFINKSHARG